LDEGPEDSLVIGPDLGGTFFLGFLLPVSLNEDLSTSRVETWLGRGETEAVMARS